ncbi:L-TYPE LECTIN-DOMAIN CONTAINING RECEPTOR KINASE VIII.2, partial [Salix purpurea]
MSLSRKTSSVLPSPIVLFLLLCLVLQRTKAASTDFDFGTLTLSGLKLLGDAHLDNGCVRLTRDLAVPNSGAGKVLYSKPIRFRQPSAHSIASFSTFFSFSVTNLNPSSIGGGLAFVISPDSDNLGAAGGFLGLLNIDEGPQAASTFVAVEFDTLMDVEFKDINGNHVGLDLNSMVSSQIGDLGAINIDLKSGDLVNAWIDYDGPNQIFNISVSYSNLKPKEPILSFSLDLDQYVNDFMYVGFSGSTQGSTETHSIEWWSFSSSFQSSLDSESSSSVPPPPTASLMNPTANSVKSPPSTLAPRGLESVSGKSAKSNSCHNQLCKQGAGAVAGVVTASAFFVIFAGVLIWVFSKRFKHVKKPVSIASEVIKMPKEFSYRELKSATKCFNANRIIGRGAFGTVYKGILPESGEIVAVKRCSHSSQGKTEFLSELSIIGTLRHRNLVRLQGWCHEKGEILLVYDLMRNGSLDKALFEAKTPLSWSHRRKKGTSGVGKVAVNGNLVEWVWSLHREGRLLMAADARLLEEEEEGQYEEDEMRRVLLVGLACSHPDPMARPTMRGVVQMLVGEAEVPLVPRTKPTMSFSTSHLLLSLQDSVSDCNGIIALSSSSSENSFNGGHDPL